MKIILADKTEVKDLVMSGNTLVSGKEVKRSVLEGKLSTVTYVYDDGTQETKKNMMVANIANYGYGWLICLTEKGETVIPADLQDKAEGYDILMGGI